MQHHSSSDKDMENASSSPVYHAFPTTHAAHPQQGPVVSNLCTPLPDAPPDQVRSYLVALMQIRGVPLARAQEISSRWSMGTGRELRSYPVVVFRDTFGADGWMLYRDVKTRLQYEETGGRWRTGLSHWGMVWMSISIMVMLGVLGAGIALTYLANWNEDGTTYNGAAMVVGIILVLVGGLGFLIALAVLLFWRRVKAPEERVEKELMDEWEKGTAM